MAHRVSKQRRQDGVRQARRHQPRWFPLYGLSMDHGDYMDLGPAVPSGRIPTLFEERYERLALIGQGRFSEVFEGYDQVAREHVAIKVFRRDARAASIRREVLALSTLRLQGIAKLRDYGRQSGIEFLVLDLVQGTEFPGGANSWTRWSAVFQRLLEIVSTIHQAGVLHLDLKPSNVFVRPDGSVSLLDFGLALGPGVGGFVDPKEFRSGTLAYIAPERLLGRGDRRSDLYSLGKMALASLPSDTPPEAAALLKHLVALDADQRPTTAERVLSDLFGTRWDGPVLFVGPERLLRERSIGREALSRRSGDTRTILASWRARGWCYATPTGVRLTPEGRRHLTSTQQHTVVDRTMDAAIASARQDRSIGRLEQALGGLELALWKVQLSAWEGDDVPSQVDLAIEEIALTAVETEDLASLYRAECLTGRMDSTTARCATELLTACRLLASGRATKARAVLEKTVPPSAPLEFVWHRLNAQLAALRGELAAALRQAEAWAVESGTMARARVLGWRGVAAYQEGRFADAAELQLKVASNSQGAPRISALLNAASALMETGALAQAHDVVQQGLNAAQAADHLSFEVRAEWLLRSILYRQGHWSVDQELVQAAMQLETPGWKGLLLMNEAAMAWRSGGSASMAEEAVRALRKAGNRDALDLSMALVATSQDSTELIDRTLKREPDDLGWQVLGLLAMRELLPAELKPDAHRMAQAANDHSRRRDLLAPIEILSFLS